MKTNLVETPLEYYEIDKIKIAVKREDLCGGVNAPTFSKIRGILPHLRNLQKKGINIVGYTETSISMAGWGVAWACKLLGMKAFIFDPQYKVDPELLMYHRRMWESFGAVSIPIPAGMAKVNWYISKKMLNKMCGEDAILLPLGLPFEDTIEATSVEFKRTIKDLPEIKTVVVNIGSGTICAGIFRAVGQLDSDIQIIGVMGRTGNVPMKRHKIENKAALFFQFVNFRLVDPGWEYTQKSETDCPFPSHPYYDLKAWEWLQKNVKELSQPILFWNIGNQIKL